MRLLLVSHGRLAAGMADVLTNFFGLDNVTSACVSMERGAAGLSKDIDEFLSTCGDEQVVVCSDLMGGSANQTAMPCLARPNTFLIAGMNLPLCLQLALLDEDVTAEGLKEIVAQSREAIVLMNDMTFEMGEEDE